MLKDSLTFTHHLEFATLRCVEESFKTALFKWLVSFVVMNPLVQSVKKHKKNKQMHVYDKVFQPPVKPREIDFLEWKIETNWMATSKKKCSNLRLRFIKIDFFMVVKSTTWWSRDIRYVLAFLWEKKRMSHENSHCHGNLRYHPLCHPKKQLPQRHTRSYQVFLAGRHP